MRILLVNPNMSTDMTDRMADIARRIAGPDVDIVPLTARSGFPYIASRAEAQIAGGIAFDMIAENLAGADAVVMAAFGDPGLRGARELFDLPVIGMAEAAMLSAAMLGERFAIVTFSPVMRRWYLDCVHDSGLMGRCCGVRTPKAHPEDMASMRETLRADLVALARQAIDEDGAEVIILGGAPLAGLAPEISDMVPAIVIDPIAAAVSQAIAMVRITTPSGFLDRQYRPLPKQATGLAPALTDILAGQMRQ